MNGGYHIIDCSSITPIQLDSTGKPTKASHDVPEKLGKSLFEGISNHKIIILENLKFIRVNGEYITEKFVNVPLPYVKNNIAPKSEVESGTVSAIDCQAISSYFKFFLDDGKGLTISFTYATEYHDDEETYETVCGFYFYYN